ncbi:unnamed protein product [Durusdinium trenchii]|uniref:Spondin-like TSP1 domain-containing protein n=1 Tax=Durusdinium trenchii TaxID=1381693 RepID=A0ABP0QVN9_9DINO
MPTPGGKPCEPLHKEEIVPCNTESCSRGACIDAVWKDWSSWEACSKTCDGGITWRHRTLRQKANECGRPATGALAPKVTLGPGTRRLDARSLNRKLVRRADLTFSKKAVLGAGMAMEHAACNRGIPCEKDVDCENGKWCVGPLKQTAPCPSGPDCFGGPPVDCEVSNWDEWDVCSTTCGPGQKIRSRRILQRPENGGKFCDGELTVTESCNNAPCHTCTPTDCMWGQWEMWGACDKCGGQRKRFRRVTVQADCGGRICERDFAEEMGNCTRICHTPTYCTSDCTEDGAQSFWQGSGQAKIVVLWRLQATIGTPRGRLP